MRGAETSGVIALVRWLQHLVGTAAREAKTFAFRAAGMAFHARSRAPLAAPSRILVLQLQQLGDSVIFTPTLRAIRARFPDARIELLATPVAAQIYKKSPYVDKIHIAKSWSTSAGGTRIRPMLPLLRELRREGYDCTITDVAQQAFKYSLIAWLVGARLRIGFDILGRGFLHTVRVPFRPNANWVDANLDIARALGASPAQAHEEVAFDESDSERVRLLLTEAGHDGKRRTVVMHTGANWQSRTWYRQRWAALGDTLQMEHNAAVVFVGSGAEAEYVEQIRGAMKTPSISLVRLTDIPQLAALCAQAELFVGTDSGPRQIARASGCPHVVIMCSQDDTDRWAGWAKGEVIMRSFPPCHGCYFAHCAHKVCMDAMETDRVLEWCVTLLDEAAPRLSEPRQDRVRMPGRLVPIAGKGKAVLRALARGPGAPT